MKLSDLLIEDLVKELAGEDTIELVRILMFKKNVSEFKLAEDLKINVNRVRNMLYRLASHNLVSSIRKKDRQKGWYIYYWTFNLKHARSLLVHLRKKRVEGLKELLEKKKREENYFTCSNRCIIMNTEDAMENQFRCPECGKLLEQKSSVEDVKEIEDKIKKLESDLKVKWEEIPELEEEEKIKILKKKKIKKKRKRKVIKKVKRKKEAKKKLRKKPRKKIRKKKKPFKKKSRKKISKRKKKR